MQTHTEINPHDVIMRSSFPSQTGTASRRNPTELVARSFKKKKNNNNNPTNGQIHFHAVSVSRQTWRLTVNISDVWLRRSLWSCLLTEPLEQLSGRAVTTLKVLLCMRSEALRRIVKIISHNHSCLINALHSAKRHRRARKWTRGRDKLRNVLT